MNVIGILGLGAAIELLLEVGIANIEERVLGLGEVIIQEAEQRKLTVLTPKEKTGRGGSITISGGFDPVKMRDALRMKGILVNARGGGIRISPHFYNTEEELSSFFSAFDVLR